MMLGQAIHIKCADKFNETDKIRVWDPAWNDAITHYIYILRDILILNMLLTIYIYIYRQC